MATRNKTVSESYRFRFFPWTKKVFWFVSISLAAEITDLNLLLLFFKSIIYQLLWARNRWFSILEDIFCLLNFCLFSRRPSAFQQHNNMITFSLNRVFVFWNFLWHFFIKVADLIIRLMKRSFVWARTDKNRKMFHVNICKACRYYYKNDLSSVKLP